MKCSNKSEHEDFPKDIHKKDKRQRRKRERSITASHPIKSLQCYFLEAESFVR